MKKGTYIYAEDVIQNLTFLNITHHLKITEECLKYLLGIIKNELGSQQSTQGYFLGNDMDVQEIVGLCKTNAELIDCMHELLSKRALDEQENTFVREHQRKKVPEECHFGQTSSSNKIFDKSELDQQFRVSIVDLMSISLQCWEQCTKKNKIELAEESKIWRINIDGGRLRVRSMDRYLSVANLPKAPRWRDVLKTAYFVLDHVEPNSPVKRKLETCLEHTLRIMRLKSH